MRTRIERLLSKQNLICAYRKTRALPNARKMYVVYDGYRVKEGDEILTYTFNQKDFFKWLEHNVA